jgi:putative sigma-54 modulation protein
MNIEITGRHLDITEPIKEFVQKRTARFTKLAGGSCDFHLVLAVEKHRQIAEVVLNTKVGTFNATEESKDLYASIGSALEKIEKQLRKQKERRKDIARNTDKEQLHFEMVGAPITDLGKPSDLADHPEIVEMVLDARPMAPEEAALELHESGGSFVVFYNARSEQVNVLYRRNDGNLGLIRP